MNANKRWIPILLILLFIVGWEFFVIRPYSKKPASPVTAQNAAPGSDAAKKQATEIQPKSPTGVATGEVPNPNAPSAQNIQAAEMVLDPAKAVTLDLGEDRSAKVYANGVIGGVLLANYSVREHKEKVPVVLIPQGMRWTSTQPEVQQCLNSMKRSAASPTTFEGVAGAAKCSVTYARLPGDEGLVNVSLSVAGVTPAPNATVNFAGVGNVGLGRAQDHNYIDYRADGSHESLHDKKMMNPTLKQGRVEWLVWGDSYFSTVLLPDGTLNPLLLASASGDEKNLTVAFGFQYPMQPVSQMTYALKMYAGPKYSERFAAISPTLKDALALGFFGSIARLMLWCLKGLYSVVGNWGVAIVVLTLLVRLLFLPLNRKVYQSSAKMKALQPQVERIRKKFGTDREKAAAMNLELMALYRTNKVNPMGSCLPLLLQMPIFFGLYSALNHSILLYQAPFAGWIMDLSSPDPFYVLPVLWTISLLGYIFLNPQTASPQAGMPDMRWMMIAMNIFFGFLAKDWPSGLNLYLVVSNLVGVTQQFVMQRGSKELQPVQEGA